MLVEDDEVLRAELIANLRREYNVGQRRSGTHMTDLIYCLTKVYWEHDEPGMQENDTALLLFSIGFGLERVLINRNHVEPLVVDGISMSPDFQIDGHYADLKTTRLSPAGRKGEGGFQIPLGWVKQVMGYAYGLKQTEWSLGILHIIPPQLVVKKLTFTPEELEENWFWILERQQDLNYMLENDDPQPYMHRLYPEECDHCKFSLLCGLRASLDKQGETE